MRTRCPRRSPLLVAWHAKALSDGFRDFMVLALRDHGLERALESIEFIDLLPNVGKVLFSNIFRLRACHATDPS